MNCWTRKKCKSRKKGLMYVIDRFMLLSVLVPPGYLLYRFVRWYVRQDDGPADVDDGDGI